MEAVVLPLPLGSALVPLGDGCISVGISIVELLVGLEVRVITVWVLKHLFGACACHGNEYFCSFEISGLLLAWPWGGDGDGQLPSDLLGTPLAVSRPQTCSFTSSL